MGPYLSRTQVPPTASTLTARESRARFRLEVATPFKLAHSCYLLISRADLPFSTRVQKRALMLSILQRSSETVPEAEPSSCWTTWISLFSLTNSSVCWDHLERGSRP